MLSRRDLPFQVPVYSLTGDVLSYQRCPLQYRYYNGSSLPPSRPVQMWTGEFVHGVLEEAYRVWHQESLPFPWPSTPPGWPPVANPPGLASHDIGALGQGVEVRLAAEGKTSRNRQARQAAYHRVEAAINLLGAHLFPLISTAEQRLSGTRAMSALPVGEHARGDRYELTGIVDVISSVVLDTPSTNPLVQLLSNELQHTPAGQYDVIVDYKALRRPARSSPFRSHFEWQLQTYAWLRRQQPNTNPVGAGMIIYVNELAPSASEIPDLRRESLTGDTDIVPPNGSTDYYALHRWSPGTPLDLSFDFRLRRAIKIIDVSADNVRESLGRIDSVVAEIESSAYREHNSGHISTNWRQCGSQQDCVACDFVHFCPSPWGHREPQDPARNPPSAPG
jgi:hypothetical protein